ncbi:MAG: hypothetical protein CMJ83_15725 [Planctomycetes bacterium]|nr:hypothetical protein [Planctomycetota bacterium]
MVASRFDTWLEDPLLRRLWTAVREAGPIRSVAVDLTDTCNIRCEGCYFFAEGMDQVSAAGAAGVDGFIDRERTRGTNFVTVVGGEPSLALDRLSKLYGAFRLSVATNGVVPIPRHGFEELPIGVSVWGDTVTDRALRGGGRRDLFAAALDNYRNDPRAFWYYTVAPGHATQVESVVERCVDNGNRVLFNFYGDLEARGGDLDYRRGFGDVRDAIDCAIDRHPGAVLMTSRLADVVSSGRLFDERWGHAVCTSITPDHAANADRITNGRPYNPHFRAFHADLETTRRCCTGVERGCDSCFDTWQHFSWVMLNLKKHLRSEEDFTEWLATTYLFYFINRLVDLDDEASLLEEIHRRTRRRKPAAV